jgi:hypothetical protein
MIRGGPMCRHILTSFVPVLCIGVIAGFVSGIYGAQKTPASRCPAVRVDCPEDISSDTWTYTVRVEGVDPRSELTYKWSVSTGEIKSGQGTTTITIDKPDLWKGITVTVEVGGLPEGCEKGAACTTVS